MSRSFIAFARDAGVTMFVATHSRYVVDLNRDLVRGRPSTWGPTTRSYARRGTFANEPLYVGGRGPDAREIAARRSEYFDPYHAAARRRDRARPCPSRVAAILLDGTRSAAEVPRFFAGRLPDLNLGTVDGASCAPGVRCKSAADLASCRRRGGFHARCQRPLQGRLA